MPLALADRRLEKMQALAVERGHRRIIHLVGRDPQHFLFETDRVAGGSGLKSDPAVLIESRFGVGCGNMTLAGPHDRQRVERPGTPERACRTAW